MQSGNEATPRRKRIILHVGTQKTGSTSLQAVFRNNDKALRDVGVVYPGPDMDRRLGIGANHRAYFCALTDSFHATSGMSDLGECRSALDAAVDLLRTDAAVHTLLISHEALARRANSVERPILRAWAKEFDVNVVVYVRPLREWVESFYSQTVWNRAKGGDGSALRSPTRRLMKSIGRSLPSSIHDGYMKAMGAGTVELRSFGERRRNDDLVRHFIDASIPDVAAIYDTLKLGSGHQNASRLSCNTMFMYHLLESGADLAAIRAVANTISRIAGRANGTPPLADRKYSFLSDEDFERLEELDKSEAKRFPDLGLDVPIARKSSDSRMTPQDYALMLDWLKPQLPADAQSLDFGAYGAAKRPLARAG